MKEIVPKRDLIIQAQWYKIGRYRLYKQAVNDDEICQSFTLVFFQHLHKSLG